MVSDADIVVSGHIHEAWQVEVPRHGLSNGGHERRSTQLHISCATYKDDWTLEGGWHMERGAPPKPLGGWWLELAYDYAQPGHVGVGVRRAS